LKINVDQDERYDNPKHRGRPHPQSVIRQYEIKRQVMKMQEVKMIRTAQTSAYSQVLLTPKPNGEWRF
jgi:hypothetical protein